MTGRSVLYSDASSVDRSGTIAAGGTAQVLMAANGARNGFMVQNHSAGDLWVNELGGTALLQQPSICIPSKGLYESPLYVGPKSAVSIIGATTGQAFTAREY